MIEEQARSIFFDTLERAPDQWCAYLDGACGSNVELRARVDELLRAHGSIGSIHNGFTSTPPVEHRVVLLEGPGTVIGPYRLLQKIGEGGFGIVYMAEQIQPVRRKVALKILKPGMDTGQVMRILEGVTATSSWGSMARPRRVNKPSRALPSQRIAKSNLRWIQF